MADETLLAKGRALIADLIVQWDTGETPPDATVLRAVLAELDRLTAFDASLAVAREHTALYFAKRCPKHTPHPQCRACKRLNRSIANG